MSNHQILFKHSQNQIFTFLCWLVNNDWLKCFDCWESLNQTLVWKHTPHSTLMMNMMTCVFWSTHLLCYYMNGYLMNVWNEKEWNVGNDWETTPSVIERTKMYFDENGILSDVLRGIWIPHTILPIDWIDLWKCAFLIWNVWKHKTLLKFDWWKTKNPWRERFKTLILKNDLFFSKK